VKELKSSETELSGSQNGDCETGLGELALRSLIVILVTALGPAAERFLIERGND
jgi:hypothetical protein